MRTIDTVVIGGGVSGLIYARERALKGEQVLVVEAKDNVGGAVWSHTLEGIETNTGAEAFAIGRGAMLGLVNDLGLGDRVVAPATGSSFIVGDDRAYASPRNAVFGMPAKPLAKDVREALGFWGALRAWRERLVPAKRATGDDVTVAEFVRARYGKAVLERLVTPIIRGVHSADPEKLELRAVMPRLARRVQELGNAHKAIDEILDQRGVRSSSGSAVHSLEPSMAELPKALARDIEAHGGHIFTHTPVTGLRASSEERAWIVTAATQATAVTREFKARSLVIATGPEVARHLLSASAPAIADLIPVAPATPVRLATLVLDNPELNAKPRGNGVLVDPASTAIRAKAMTHASAKWEHIHRAAEASKPGRNVVRLSYNPDADGSLPDTERFPELAIHDAAAIFGLQASDLSVADWALTDWTGTMRQSGPGHTAALEALAEALETQTRGADAALPHLELTGAWRAGNGLEAITRFTREIASR
ncbi:protoporphyrinogen oxidase [Dermabacter sp. p3-SID358]|uniref:protoporphyrinogen oxidase n=1 Tax=Dermabacter sp. p3-SID358 TaxID=2916114 RepID=UPI0021A408DE|nr:protoporphyrinogen oxidase [Dermabacter sp. p3-SID358]MCT1866891.1 protoporphyrinogen oxidase [Dermabacter sp. p3-SID358]